MYSKNGCRTCKIRKVKCDEGYPSCQRCVSTGRRCDGYAFWTQKKTLKQTKGTEPRNTDIPHLINTLCVAASTEEREYLDWFKVRTVTKLPGSFMSEFWSQLLLQASSTEPAILHASLALSAVHKIDTVELRYGDKPLIEQFALNHYLKALSHLKTHFCKRDRLSSQVILIACILFVSLECLRGHIGSARGHIENGLNIIKELNPESNDYRESLTKVRRPTLTDEWIVETILRLDTQTRLFGQEGTHHFSTGDGRSSIPRNFRSFKDAWKSLDEIKGHVTRLTDVANYQHKDSSLPPDSQSLSEQKETILRALRRWLSTWNSSDQSLRETIPGIMGDRAAFLAKIHHTMTTIMAEVCLRAGDEMIFDTQDNRFIDLLEMIVSLSNATPPEERSIPSDQSVSTYTTRRGSIVDLGCISPLYYVVTKCRLHHVRMTALALLERYLHREGLWDPIITNLVARKVVQIEEMGFYDGIETPESDASTGSETTHLLCEPRLPDSHRIGDIEMILSGNPTKKIFLLGRMHGNRLVKTCIAEYDMVAGSWSEDYQFMSPISL